MKIRNNPIARRDTIGRKTLGKRFGRGKKLSPPPNDRLDPVMKTSLAS
jgi:hypothetical protein